MAPSPVMRLQEGRGTVNTKVVAYRDSHSLRLLCLVHYHSRLSGVAGDVGNQKARGHHLRL